MSFRTGRARARVWACALVLSVADVAWGQSPGTLLLPPLRVESHPVSPFIVDGWTPSQGLPEGTISTIVQTRDGYLWLGSFAGLARFDGVAVRQFTVGNTPGVRSNRIHSLLEDRHGTLWVGTESDGVFSLRDGVWSTPPWNASLPDPQVWTMTEGRDGALWLGTSRGVARVNQSGHVTTYTARDGLPLREVHVITEARDGTIWVGLWAGGVVRIVGDTMHPFRAPDLGEDALVSEIYEDPAGTIWIGTDSERIGQVGGIFRVDGERADLIFSRPASRTTSLLGESPTFRVRSIVRDPSGGLWVATNGGLWRVDGTVHTRYGVESGLADNHVTTVQFDREGNLWIALDSSGLHRLKRRLATTYLPQTVPRMAFVPIVGDGADGFWAGSICQGLWHFSNGVFERYSGEQGLAPHCIWALHRDPDGTLWLGDSRGGLFRIEGGRVTAMPRAGPSVNAIMRDRAGTLWIGATEGLKRLVADDTFETHPLPVAGAILFLADRGAGGLWVGTSSGLFAFDQGRFTRWSTETGLSHDIVRAVLEDPDGTVWVGTDGGGLNRMKEGRITHYSTDNGLFDNVVSHILDDGRGNLWMSGSKGVFRVARTELTAVADDDSARVSSVWYDTSDGMVSSATSGGGQPAGWQAPDGQLWFPTASGLVSIDPAAPTNTLPPPVALTSVVVDRQARDPTANRAASAEATASQADLVLSPGVQNLEIHYTGLSFVAPEKVQFRYRLVGYDEQWVEAGPRRVAYYSYLPPGRYRFEVRARNDAGVWSAESAALGVYQAPHVYQTSWFATLAAVAVTLLGVAGYQVRLRQLLRRTQELETSVAARTEEVVRQRNELSTVHQELINTHGQLASTHGQLEQGHRELTKAHDDLLATLNQTRLGVCMVERGGAITFLNAAALQVLGCSAADAVGLRWQDVLPLADADREHVDTLVRQPAAERQRLPVRLETAEGYRYWMEIDVRDDPRDAARRILYLHDVTELYDLQRLLDGGAQFQGLVGDTAAIRLVYRQIRDVAVVDSTAVIEGETGTGKELVARAIHDRSARKARPFLAVNCAGLTESLLASQLFGHQRGAFTGAVADQLGLFETANGGTLLLDEIGDIPQSVQANLLRVLQEREITRVGESRPRKIDVRILAATHRDLQEEAAAGRFRQDLFYRLRIVRIHVPPLRERRDDIPVLVAWFLGQLRATNHSRVYEVSRAAMDVLIGHPWPGNVRELKGVIESAAVTAKGPIIEVTDLPAELLKPAAVPAGAALDAREREHVRLALDRTHGNRAAAARLLGVSRATLYRRLRELGLDT